MVIQKYTATHADQLTALNDKLDLEAQVANAVKSFGTQSQSPSTAGGPSVSTVRTNASPDWGGSPPWNVRKRFSCTPISIADFENGNTLLVRIVHSLCMWGTPKFSPESS